MKTFDIAFIGLGASSLSTLKIKYENSSLSIIGIDKNFNDERNNFFAFWMTDWMKQFEGLTTQKWENWEFVNYKTKINHESVNMPYSVIRFRDWRNYCLEKLSNFSFKLSYVSSIKKQNGGYLISLENGEQILAKKIYDSRGVLPKDDSLKQHFIGHLIQTESSHNQTVAKLMDFRVNQDKGLHFMYVLPIDDKRLLVESTVFSKNILKDEWYEEQINIYTKNILKIDIFKIIDIEKGILPMFEIKSESSKNYINIGTRDGATKISSGYAFSFFLKKILNEEKYYHSFWDKWMDKVFVKYLENSNKNDEIFIKMANSLNGSEFASFMMGIANTKVKLKVIFSMPKIGFIKSLLSSL